MHCWFWCMLVYLPMSNFCWSTSLKSRIIKYSLWKTFFHRSRATCLHWSGLARRCKTSGLRIWHTLCCGQGSASSKTRTRSSSVDVAHTRSSHSCSPFTVKVSSVGFSKSSWRHWRKLAAASDVSNSLLTLDENVAEECWSPWWWYTAIHQWRMGTETSEPLPVCSLQF